MRKVNVFVALAMCCFIVCVLLSNAQATSIEAGVVQSPGPGWVEKASVDRAKAILGAEVMDSFVLNIEFSPASLEGDVWERTVTITHSNGKVLRTNLVLRDNGWSVK